MSQQDVYKFMEEGRWYTADEISQAINLRKSSVVRNLKRMAEFGEIMIYRKHQRAVFYKKVNYDDKNVLDTT